MLARALEPEQGQALELGPVLGRALGPESVGALVPEQGLGPAMDMVLELVPERVMDMVLEPVRALLAVPARVGNVRLAVDVTWRKVALLQ